MIVVVENIACAFDKEAVLNQVETVFDRCLGFDQQIETVKRSDSLMCSVCAGVIGNFIQF